MPITLHMKGLAASPGWAMGVAHVLVAHALKVSHFPIAAHDVPIEQAKLKKAFDSTLAELAELRLGLEQGTHAELVAFIEVHELMLHDPVLVDETLAYIAQHQVNAAWALSEQVQTLAASFSAMQDTYLKERSFDVQQVGERVLKHLTAEGLVVQPAPVPKDKTLILIANDLAPADFVQWQHAGVQGLITEVGGLSSHTAIVARAHGLPAVLGVEQVTRSIHDGDTVVLNGQTGQIWINPDADELVQLYHALTQWQHEQSSAQLDIALPAVTACGQKIEVYANIESPDDMPSVLQAHLDGVGLMRSEFLFMGQASLPSEEQQYQAYSKVVQALAGKPAVIRTLDVGADKLLDAAHAQHVSQAPNPALGLRAIRYSLAHPELFLIQLRALLRAAMHGPVDILLPMITNVAEVLACRALLNEAHMGLDELSIPHGTVRLGVMIEIPAAAIAIDTLLPHVDFCSVGTNDLMQYLLAVDRSDHEVAHLYDPTHPALAYLLNYIFSTCATAGKPVTVCGELAGDAKLTHYLLSLGLRRFSLNPSQAAAVKAAIRQWHVSV